MREIRKHQSTFSTEKRSDMFCSQRFGLFRHFRVCGEDGRGHTWTMFSGSKKYRLQSCADLRQTITASQGSIAVRFASPEIQSHVARSTKAPGPRVYSIWAAIRDYLGIRFWKMTEKRVVRTEGRCSAALGSHDSDVFVSKARLDKIRLIKLTDTAASGSWLHHVKKKKEVQATPEVDISGKLGMSRESRWVKGRLVWCFAASEHVQNCDKAIPQGAWPMRQCWEDVETVGIKPYMNHIWIKYIYIIYIYLHDFACIWIISAMSQPAFLSGIQRPGWWVCTEEMLCDVVWRWGLPFRHGLRLVLS